MDRSGDDELQRILDAMPFMFFQKDTKNRIVRTNQAAADAVGVPVDVLVGSDTTEHFPDEAGSYYADDLSVMNSGVPKLGFLEEFPVQGSGKHWVRTDKFPSYDHAGNIDGVVIFFSDATAEAAAIEALRKSEQRLRTIVESEPEGVLVFDIDGVVSEINRAGLLLIGADALDDLQETTMYDMVAPEHHDLFGEFHRGIRDGGAATLDFEIIGLRGEARWINAHGVLLVGEENTVLAICRDITERRESEVERQRLEAQIRHVQRLESIGVLASGIAHDFNNSLLAIMANTEHVLSTGGGESPWGTELESILAIAQQAAGVCDQMLTYAGVRTVEPINADLSLLVQETAGFLRSIVPTDAELSFDLATPLPEVRIDPALLAQLLVNLVMNASESLTAERRRVEVRTAVTLVNDNHLADLVYSHISPGRHVALTVSDTGSGMEQDVMDQMFDPFYSTKFAGRGLGLATVLGTVKTHAGALKVRSAPGEGTTIEVLIPVTTVHTALQVRPPAATPTIDGTILLVEDHDVVRTALTTILETAGFRIVAASTGDEALAIFRSNPATFAAVVLDVTMPGLSGPATYQAIRTLDPEVAVVFSSGLPAAESDLDRHLSASVEFIQKPYRGAELIDAIQRVIHALT